MMSIHVSDHHRSEHHWHSSMSDSDSYSDDGDEHDDLQIAGHGAVGDLHHHAMNVDNHDGVDDLEDDDEDDDDDDMDKISCSPSITDEDIDFNFVYAFHNFVATVEGQANAAKGDTMVLLDDSNSYWWLVRVVKDNTIGYLPAEHIETPTERLARLNKHRNIDLAATMLGDTMEKPTNPLRKAMRRRGGKSVVFAEPTYVEASDYDYSSDEELEEEEDQGTPIESEQQASSLPEEKSIDGTPDAASDHLLSPISPSEPKSNDLSDSDPTTPVSAPSASSIQAANVADVSPTTATATAPDSGSSTPTSRPAIRNTDSFFKDEDTVTRKISLTPNILRESENSPQDAATEPDTDKKTPPERKDDKKEKKSGILSNLFKRRTAKSPSKSSTDDDKSIGSPNKSSESISTPGSPSSESISGTEKRPARLTKNRDRITSPPRSAEKSAVDATSQSSPVGILRPRPSDNFSNIASTAPPVSRQLDFKSQATTNSGAPLHGLVSSMDLSDDDADDDDDSANVPPLVGDTSSQEDESVTSSPLGHKDADEPVHIADTRDTRSGQSVHGDHVPLQLSGSSLSHSTASIDSSSSRQVSSALSFSSTKLLNFIQQPSHVRDLLLVIRDVDNVEPVTQSHPIMAGLFASETEDLDRIGRDLDNLLSNWFEKRSPGPIKVNPQRS